MDRFPSGSRLKAIVAALSGAVLTISAAEPLASEFDGSVSQASQPAFTIPPGNVLASKIVQQNGREVTLRKIRPITMPGQRTAVSANLLSLSSVQQRAAEIQQEHPERSLIQAAATIFRPTDSPPLSLVQLWLQGGEAVRFWSSADFAYLSGVTSFTGVDGKSDSLLLMACVSQARTHAEVLAQAGPQLPPPPEFAGNKAAFSIVSTDPVPEETRVAIQALHDLYNHEHDRLKAAYETRQRAHLQQQAEAKVHPPEKRPVTLSYWRTETSTSSTETNGDAAGKGATR